MRCIVTALCFSGLLWTAGASPLAAQAIDWIGEISSDGMNPDNWGGGVLPGPGDAVEIRNGDSPNALLNLGGNVEWGHILFNHADFGTTIEGFGTITVNVPGGGTNVDIKAIESQGGERVSTIYPNVVTNALIEARNGHQLVFEGEVTAHTIHAYQDADTGAVSEVVFNGPFNHTGWTNGGDFITGSGTVVFNHDFHLDRPNGGGFGIRNGMTMALGPDVFLSRLTPSGFATGLDVVNLYSEATVRVDGDYLLGHQTHLFSRYGGPGSGHDPNNTLNLNGYSDAVAILGTHPGANFTIDFGSTPGANSLEWYTTHHMVGTYEIINFEFGIDSLYLGTVGEIWWTELDEETSGDPPGGSPDIEVKKSQITINGISYSAHDPNATHPYWTLVDPWLSREVEFFNLDNLPNADFDGDGIVDGHDFLAWQRDNSLGDLSVWESQFGGSALASAVAAVPEPGTLALVFLGFAGALGCRVRRAMEV